MSVDNEILFGKFGGRDYFTEKEAKRSRVKPLYKLIRSKRIAQKLEIK